MKFIELQVKYNILRNQLDACNTSDFCLEILLVRVATIIELGNHEIFKQSILKFDILINSHIVYSNIWSPYLIKVRMSVAILSHISGNEFINHRGRSPTSDDLEWVVILTYLKNMASKISILKDIYFENRFIYNKLEAILFEEMRRIGLLREIVKYTESFL